MVIAYKTPSITGIGKAHFVAAMRAGIQEDLDGAVFLAANDHAIFTHVSGEKIARIGNLRIMSNKQPATGKNLLHFPVVNGLFLEHAAIQPAFVQIHVVVVTTIVLEFLNLHPSLLCGYPAVALLATVVAVD